MASGENKKLLRILCLHGYRQTGKIFSNKTGALRKVLKKQAELVYIKAPNDLDASDEEESTSGWWFSSSNKTYIPQDYTDSCIGYEDSLNCVASALEELGPFDGILGFSQGASLLSLICALKEDGDQRFQGFRFAVFVSGYKSRQLSHKNLYEKFLKISLPTLHVVGCSDQVIPREMSDELLEHYDNAVVVRHTGGHFVPSAADQKKAYIEFLKQFLN